MWGVCGKKVLPMLTPRQRGDGQGSLISALNAPPSIRRESISRTAVASASTAAPPNSARSIIPPATPIVAPLTPLMAQPARAPTPFIVPPAKTSTSPTPSADASLYETASRGFAYPPPSSQPPPPHPQLAPPALPATPSASASSRPPLPPPHAPRPRALRRLLRLGRQHELTGALGQWRLALAHLLRRTFIVYAPGTPMGKYFIADFAGTRFRRHAPIHLWLEGHHYQVFETPPRPSDLAAPPDPIIARYLGLAR